MAMPPYQPYCDQLSFLSLGYPLWNPDPAECYNQVSIGDVSYTKEGSFFRLFNVLLPWDHPSNHTFCEPEHYIPLDLGPFVNIHESRFLKGNYCTPHVTIIQQTEEIFFLSEEE